MNQVQGYNPYNTQVGTPLYNYGAPVAQPAISSTPVPQSGINPIYQYPTTSLYGVQPTQSGQAASGVNINIYNPMGMGSFPPTVVNNPVPVVNTVPSPEKSIQPAPVTVTPQEQISNTPISDKETAKTTNAVELSDDYIKTLENYLRSNDATVRKSAITQIVKRFEEDKSRYEDPALTALLNIALQDPEPANRIMAMTPIATGSAHGDANSVKFLTELQKSNKLHGQEAKMANEALLSAVNNKKMS